MYNRHETIQMFRGCKFNFQQFIITPIQISQDCFGQFTSNKIYLLLLAHIAQISLQRTFARTVVKRYTLEVPACTADLSIALSFINE